MTLLEQAEQGRACIGKHKVTAADICILVRDRVEAQIMKKHTPAVSRPTMPDVGRVVEATALRDVRTGGAVG